MFDNIFSSGFSAIGLLLMIGVALLDGVVLAFIMSRKMRTGKGLLVTVSLLPAVVSAAFCFLNVVIKTDSTSAIAAIASIMVGMGLIRFRSAPGKAEEMCALFAAVACGAINGLGYLAYASIFAVVIAEVFVLLMSINIFKNTRFAGEKLLKITIPETLEYGNVFDEIFAKYLKEVEMIGVKTTGMGSMFRLTYRIVIKNPVKEKEMIDDLRVKNGNLEISVLPYVEDANML